LRAISAVLKRLIMVRLLLVGFGGGCRFVPCQ
jgi:hypothetical protein